MTDRLFDTNIVQALIEPRQRGRSPELVRKIETRVREQGGLVVSAVTVYELRRGVRTLRLQEKGRTKEVRLELLLRSAVVLGLDVPSFAPWDTAADLYARGRTQEPAVLIDDADLLIAATARHFGRTLVTSDRRLAENLGVIGAGPLVELLRPD